MLIRKTCSMSTTDGSIVPRASPCACIRERLPSATWLCFGAAIGGLCAGCRSDRPDRWDDELPVSVPPSCTVGDLRCRSGLERCEQTPSGATWHVIDDCAAKHLVCAPGLNKCTTCVPDERTCNGPVVSLCSSDGATLVPERTCDAVNGYHCRAGACQNLCSYAASVRSNVGCEYWAADLDNAMINTALNAAAQQYAIVVSNPQPDVSAMIAIDQDDSEPGSASMVSRAASAEISPLNLRVFKLGPREVDGSPDGEFNTGTGTALTRHGYRIRSDVPVVAYQFNPLDNVGVFSNDASLLKPVEALLDTPGTLSPAYVIVGWPQTIASTQDPNTNFNPSDPIDLRVFVTILGTRPNTHVRFTTATRIIPGSGIPETPPGGRVEATLQPFDVLNLESGGFNADFTGSFLESDQPVVVFSGGEASDAPAFATLADRFCCADHLEEQNDPIRTAGKTFVAPHSPSRTRAVLEAGGPISIVNEPEFFRVVAVSDEGPTTVMTTLPPPYNSFVLDHRGSYRDVTVFGPNFGHHYDFMITTDRPVILGDVQPSQDASYVRRGFPGGDPSIIIVPPIEQYRTSYIFLTPDKYSFDFIVVISPSGATILLDDNPIDSAQCTVSPADGLTADERGRLAADYVVYRCQLSFPIIHPDVAAPDNVLPGNQNDGVHRVASDMPVMVLAYGFDNYVSYGYAAGTQLEVLGPAK